MVGKKAPLLKGINQKGEPIRLKDYRGRHLVLYFYPKDDTPGCTKESCSFRDGHEAVREFGAEILGVSPDPAKSHQKFIQKHQLTFDLVADVDQVWAQSFGVWVEKSMYGKTYMGVERSTFILGPDGTVREAFRKVKPEGHVEEVLAWLKSQGGKT
ncbi:MAG: thioredoxin-dependent thiol peroxidase [Blastochloris sp.]|nr:thioredoxin-dependent thiol peroxidase [Blastochloris sp.]